MFRSLPPTPPFLLTPTLTLTHSRMYTHTGARARERQTDRQTEREKGEEGGRVGESPERGEGQTETEDRETERHIQTDN